MKQKGRARKKARPSGLPLRLLSAGEVADVLGVHVNTVRKWADSGFLSCYRFGLRGDRRFASEDIIRFMQQRRSSGARNSKVDKLREEGAENEMASEKFPS